MTVGTYHLTTSLHRHDDDDAAQVGPATENVEVCDLPVRVFLGDLRLDEFVFGEDIRVVDIAVGVQLSEGLQALVGAVVIAEPS